MLYISDGNDTSVTAAVLDFPHRCVGWKKTAVAVSVLQKPHSLGFDKNVRLLEFERVGMRIISISLYSHLKTTVT